MSLKQLIKKKEESMISGSVRGRCVFSLLADRPLFPSLFLFISWETLIPFLQNSHFLSRQFTFKYFNNYFSKKKEIALHKIFKLWLLTYRSQIAKIKTWMSVWILWDVIWACFFTKPVCWQNSCVILEKSCLSHMGSFSTENW
jgi:hypothetical protein